MSEKIIKEKKIEVPWKPIHGLEDLPREGRWLITLLNTRTKKRSVALISGAQMWAGQRALAYAPIPEPYDK